MQLERDGGSTKAVVEVGQILRESHRTLRVFVLIFIKWRHKYLSSLIWCDHDEHKEILIWISSGRLFLLPPPTVLQPHFLLKSKPFNFLSPWAVPDWLTTKPPNVVKNMFSLNNAEFCSGSVDSFIEGYIQPWCSTGSFRKNGKSKNCFMWSKFHEKLIFSAFLAPQVL